MNFFLKIARTLLMALGVSAMLCACGGGSDTASRPVSSKPGPPAILAIQSGDGQGVNQHSVLPQALQVRVTDASGNNVPNVPVTFSAADGNAYITPSTVNTNMDGIAEWNGFVHALGQQIVQATSPGLPAVMFTLAVTPSSHYFDGLYDCKDFSAAGVEDTDDPGYLRISINEGKVSNASKDLVNSLGYYASSFDEATGSISIIQRWSLDFEKSFTGQMVILQEQRGTASGTWVFLGHLNPLPPDDPIYGGQGTWTCDRE